MASVGEAKVDKCVHKLIRNLITDVTLTTLILPRKLIQTDISWPELPSFVFNNFSSLTKYTMSTSSATINTTTGNHPVDPYKAQNFEDPPLPQKIEELTSFISQVKFGMLTTKQSDGDYLASRCMALAAQVWHFPTFYASIHSDIKA